MGKFDKASKIADYFSGTLFLNQNNYIESYKYLKKLDGLEESHDAYSSKYLFSLINSGNLNQAFYFSKKLEKNNQDSYESNLITGIYYLKNANYEISKNYFLKAQQKTQNLVLDRFVAQSLYIWSDIKKKNNSLEKAKLSLNKLDTRLENLNRIQNVFINCFFESKKTDELFKKLTSDENTDFSRYNYFYAKYLNSIGKKNKAKLIINNSLKKYPRNLLLNQYKIDLENNEKGFEFSCKKPEHIIAEVLYISANALSSQSIYNLSNFYINLSKFLNKDFHSFNTLLAENFYKIENYDTAKKIYIKISKYGEVLKWYSSKQVARILIKEDKKNESISLLRKAYNELPNKGIYETFDFAEFLKNNEEFKESIKYYTSILNKIEKSHPLYADLTDGRGISYERTGEWNRAEKDFLNSLAVKPDQAYVINYLAYSWIEKGIKINESLKMLEKANRIKSNDPYIVDSLGWALFKLKRYEESKQYLQLAVRLMPSDPIVNDHYGDVLWKNGNQIQARYYWNYVLNLEKTEKDLREKIQEKLIKGL